MGVVGETLFVDKSPKIGAFTFFMACQKYMPQDIYNLKLSIWVPHIINFKLDIPSRFSCTVIPIFSET